MTTRLERWMETHGGDSKLLYWIPKYILLRGTRQLATFKYLSTAMRRVALDLDGIGWRHFLEGKVPRSLFEHQSLALAGSTCRLTLE